MQRISSSVTGSPKRKSLFSGCKFVNTVVDTSFETHAHIPASIGIKALKIHVGATHSTCFSDNVRRAKV